MVERRVEASAKAPKTLQNLSTEELIDAWVTAATEARGSEPVDSETEITRYTLSELLGGVERIPTYPGETSEPVDPEHAARLAAVSKEIGWRLVEPAVTPVVAPTPPQAPEGTA